MNVTRRIRHYWREKGIPEQAKSDTGRSTVERLFGSIVVLIVGVVGTNIVYLPIAYALWRVFSIPMLLLALPAVVIGRYIGLFIGGPIADALLGVEREVNR